MKRPDKREQDRLKTRTAILDATAALMREEGYAAVTSRRVAERAGLKSQLVHYHFASMDELFQELFRRNEKEHFTRHVGALGAPQPLAAIWAIMNEPYDMDLVDEFVAAANHRKVLRDALANSRKNHRNLHAAVFEKHFAEGTRHDPEIKPAVLSFMLASIAGMLIEERRIGVTQDHADVAAFVEQLIGGLEPKARRAGHKRRASPAEPPVE